MGIEAELIEMMAIQLFAAAFFNHFEGETSPWRKILKWVVFDGLIAGMYFLAGHWALLLPFVLLIPGMIVHTQWCRKNGIHPVKATPRRKYYELMGWEWKE